MYIKEYLCDDCNEYKGIQFFENENDYYCFECKYKDFLYCPYCDSYQSMDCFEDDYIYCIGCAEDFESDIEEDDYEKEEEAADDDFDETKTICCHLSISTCPAKKCIWGDDGDSDYFFSPSCRSFPHAMCTN